MLATDLFLLLIIAVVTVTGMGDPQNVFLSHISDT